MTKVRIVFGDNQTVRIAGIEAIKAIKTLDSISSVTRFVSIRIGDSLMCFNTQHIIYWEES